MNAQRYKRQKSFARLKRAKLDAALQVDQREPFVLEQLGELFFEHGQFHVAIETLVLAFESSQVLGCDPSCRALSTLGCSLYEEGLLAEAGDVLRKARMCANWERGQQEQQQGGFELDVCGYMARTLVYAKNFCTARTVCLGALEDLRRNPCRGMVARERLRFGGTGALHMLAASICLSLYDTSGALYHYEMAHKGNETSLEPYTGSDIWLCVSRVYGELGQPWFQNEALNNADIRWVRPWARLAAKHEMQHDFGAALDALDQALIREPLDPNLLRAQVRCLDLSGQSGQEERIKGAQHIATISEREGLGEAMPENTFVPMLQEAQEVHRKHRYAQTRFEKRWRKKNLSARTANKAVVKAAKEAAVAREAADEAAAATEMRRLAALKDKRDGKKRLTNNRSSASNWEDKPSQMSMSTMGWMGRAPTKLKPMFGSKRDVDQAEFSASVASVIASPFSNTKSRTQSEVDFEELKRISSASTRRFKHTSVQLKSRSEMTIDTAKVRDKTSSERMPRQAGFSIGDESLPLAAGEDENVPHVEEEAIFAVKTDIEEESAAVEDENSRTVMSPNTVLSEICSSVSAAEKAQQGNVNESIVNKGINNNINKNSAEEPTERNKKDDDNDSREYSSGEEDQSGNQLVALQSSVMMQHVTNRSPSTNIIGQKSKAIEQRVEEERGARLQRHRATVVEPVPVMRLLRREKESKLTSSDLHDSSDSDIYEEEKEEGSQESSSVLPKATTPSISKNPYRVPMNHLRRGTEEIFCEIPQLMPETSTVFSNSSSGFDALGGDEPRQEYKAENLEFEHSGGLDSGVRALELGRDLSVELDSFEFISSHSRNINVEVDVTTPTEEELLAAQAEEEKESNMQSRKSPIELAQDLLASIDMEEKLVITSVYPTFGSSAAGISSHLPPSAPAPTTAVVVEPKVSSSMRSAEEADFSNSPNTMEATMAFLFNIDREGSVSDFELSNDDSDGLADVFAPSISPAFS